MQSLPPSIQAEWPRDSLWVGSESQPVSCRGNTGVVGQCQPQLDISPGPDKLKKNKGGGSSETAGLAWILGRRVNLPICIRSSPARKLTWDSRFPCGKGVCVVGSPQDRCR